ncbi:MAG: ABC transporter ATP-binding protein/permease [bacterium]|nr:ABC transporter ATP-binding protein/permease [bacterium]
MTNYLALRFIRFLKPYWKKIILAIFLTFLLTALNLLMPKLLQFFIDDIIGKQHWDWLIPLCLVMFGIFIIQGFCSYYNSYTITYIGQRVIYDIRLQLYKTLQQLSLSFYDRMNTGAIISRMMDDVTMVQNVMTGATISVITDLFTLIFVVVILFKMNWMMTLTVFAFLPFYAANFRFFKRRRRAAHRAVREKMDQIMSDLEERISGMQVVKTFSKEKFETREFVADSREALDMNMHAAFLGMTFSSIGGIISGVGSAVTLCFGAWNVLHQQMTVGEMMAFSAWAAYLYSPTARLTEIANTIQQAGISLQRIFEIFDTAPEVKEKKDAITLPKIRGRVTFEHVSFEYLPGQKVLDDINLDIAPGTIVALVGHTGCGKTTLTSLLLRFYDVTAGRITIDGYDIRDITLASLRNQIGVVLQDPALYNETIKENIRYGEPEASDEQVVKAAQVAEIHEFISKLPEKYETKLGEEGIKLSVGEKQRLSIARAVVGEPAILILDEATSSLDSESEALIQKALSNVMRGKTCFIIAHRLSTIIRSDIIVVMDKGKIVEIGSHQELVKKPNGFYATLYKRQFTIPFKIATAGK